MAELPTREEVRQLWDEYHVPGIIRRHCQTVARVAVFLAKKLKEKGVDVDAGVVERAALLHDMARSANFEDPGSQKHSGATEGDIEFWKQMKAEYGNLHHGDIAADFLQDKYPEVAEAIRAHTIGNESDRSILDAPWESRILAYADTRVVHDRITSVAERKSDSEKRHGGFFEKLRKETGTNYLEMIYSNIREIEKQIFGILDIKPEDVNDTIADIRL